MSAPMHVAMQRESTHRHHFVPPEPDLLQQVWDERREHKEKLVLPGPARIQPRHQRTHLRRSSKATHGTRIHRLHKEPASGMSVAKCENPVPVVEPVHAQVVNAHSRDGH